MPDHQVLLVPVHVTRLPAIAVLRTARRPDGQRTALAFTTAAALANAMGTEQRWITMSESALRASVAPLGIEQIQVDADLVGASITRLPRPVSAGAAPTVPAFATAVA